MTSESNSDFAPALKVLTMRIADLKRRKELLTTTVIADDGLRAA